MNFPFSRLALWLAIAGFVLPASPLHAQLANWSVVSSSNTLIPTAGFPSNVAPSFSRFSLGDFGHGLVVAATGTSNNSGHYARVNGFFTQYLKLDDTGVQGPGRSGSEAGHVFREIATGLHDIGANGQVVFFGSAGAPGSATNTLPLAVWRWDMQRNIEIARNLTDGILGPNLGLGWFFNGSGPYLLSLPNGNVVIGASLNNPTSAIRKAVVLHVAGVGNTPCILQESADLSLSPNLGDNSTFASPGVSVGYSWVAHGSKVYLAARTTANTGDLGIWEICNGAPRAIATTDRSNALGPSYGVSTAYFTAFGSNVMPGASGDLVFGAQFRDANGQPATLGIFRNRSGVNQRLAFTGTTGVQGPNWLGSTFSTIATSTLTSAGRYIAFEGDARTPDNTTVSGIWRIQPDGNPAPVALEGILGQFGPAPGQTFARFDEWTLFANGDIIANCLVNGGSNGLFRFAIGRAPEEIIRVGQVIPVQTTGGIVQATVNSAQLVAPSGDSSSSSYNWSGTDSWTGTDASVLLSASINVGGTNVNVLLLSQVADLDLLLKTGFE